MIKLFHQSVKNDIRTYENIKKIATGQGDDYTTSWLSTILSLFQRKL